MTETVPAISPKRGLYWQRAMIEAIVPQTSRVKSFVIRPSEPFALKAGQNVDVRLTAPDGYQAERSYSIASAPDAWETIELVVELLDDGEVSPFFHNTAQVGDEIELRGPIGGYFVWDISDGGPLLLIGGGSGVVPLMSMVRHRACRNAHVPFLLLVSARTVDDVLFRDELLAFDARADGFTLALALTRGQPTRPDDFSRRVDGPMLVELRKRLPEPPKTVFVCGSNPFVEAAAEAVLSTGIPAARIRTERYGG